MSEEPQPAETYEYRAEDLNVIPEFFFGLLEAIRKRPAMFIGRKSLHDLRIWLEGYRFARGQAGLPLLPDESEFDGFDDFVCKKYRWHDTGGWAAKIAYYYRDDGHALDEFFKLLDEYRAAKHRKSRRAKSAGKRKQAEPGTSSAGKT